MKNEGFKLNTMAIAFKFVINYDTLGVMEFFYPTCFRYAFLGPINMQLLKKTYKLYIGLKYTFIKSTQTYLWNYITWPKNKKKDDDRRWKLIVMQTFTLDKKWTHYLNNENFQLFYFGCFLGEIFCCIILTCDYRIYFCMFASKVIVF